LSRDPLILTVIDYAILQGTATPPGLSH